MIVAGELKRGHTLKLDDGKLYRVIKTVYNKPGRGTATMQTTMVNIETGGQVTRIFGAEDKVDQVYVESEPVEYLYRDGDMLHFMNTQTYDQYEVHASLFEDDVLFLKEGMNLELRVYEGRPIDYTLPVSVTYKVIDAEAAVVGDTAGSVQKKVTIETGRSVQVPIFINVGDMIVVDTRDGSYVGRA
ncbi:MAG: elongation factor P [Anaerolinea sp.]|nr:elongation factor P [Anaerolinea sp.]